MSSLPQDYAASARTALTVTYRRVDQLEPDPRNSRQHSKAQIKKLARSIDGLGFNVPILIDRADRIIAGHGRVLAATELGLVELPTICLDHLCDAQIAAFKIADNRLSELSTWDDERLAETLRDLSLANLEFSLELTGFDMGEIDIRIEDLDAPSKTEADPADAQPEPASGPAVSAVGDLWLLGRHRILCGNALEHESYARLMDGQQAAMVFTDPPYIVPIRGHVSGSGTSKAESQTGPANAAQALTPSNVFLLCSILLH